MTPARSSLHALVLMIAFAMVAALPYLAAPRPVAGAPQAGAATSGPGVAALPADLQAAATSALARLDASARAMPPGAYPWRTTSGGAWETTGASAWTSGFWPGCLWAAAALSGDRTWAARAEAAEAGLSGQAAGTSSNDIGFQLVPGFAAAYAATGDERARQVLLAGATSLASRYSARVGAVRSWGPMAAGGDYKVIIDGLMNLELLFWAARHGGSPRLAEIAHRHALTSARDLERPDGSTYHVAAYDPASGRLRWRGTSQGAAGGSTWSRGQAWAIYGFTLASASSGDPRLLRAARKAADYWLAHVPDDEVPPWDFDAAGGAAAQRDTSAAAVAATGLLDLARAEPDPLLAGRDEQAATALVRALAGPSYLRGGAASSGGALLRGGTEAASTGRFDLGLVYGDYYFLRALVGLAERRRLSYSHSIVPGGLEVTS